jgi:4-amino-4-deoxy-L-arabinose transferase-like glycosyltransferase
MRLWLPRFGRVIVAVVFCVPLFVGLGLNDQENDEAIYSYAAESIIETGDWLNPRSAPSSDNVFLEKPPLKFWIVALPIRLGLLPDNDFGLRFWDAVFGSAAFLYVFAIGRRMAGVFCGVTALLILYSFDSLIFMHGLRGNNMEAALVLAYAGASYHFIRWADESTGGASPRHAFAAGLYFFLGFMTKFVAAFFLPMILGAAALELKPVRDRALREWRAWGLVAAVVVVLAAPWFIYQMLQPGSGLWQIMLGEHVYQRFHGWLDPVHVKPWSYYFTDLFEQMRAAGTWWVVLAGGLLIHARVIRERWLEGTLALYWFWLPFVLMSIGTSKLRHYTYPFLPPLALAGGYAMASVANVIDGVAAGHLPAGLSQIGRALRVDLAVERARAATSALDAAWTSSRRNALRAGRVALLVAAAGCLVVAAIALVYPRRLRLGSLVFVRDPSVWRPSLMAIALGLLAGRGRAVARVAVPLILFTLLPVGWYRSTLARVATENHPLQSSRECIQAVRDEEHAAGRAAPGVFVYLPAGFYQHRYYLYFRRFGWDERNALQDEDVMRMLDTPGEQRPILMPRSRFVAVRAAYDAPGVDRPLVEADNVVLLLPGPYAKCGR